LAIALSGIVIVVGVVANLRLFGESGEPARRRAPTEGPLLFAADPSLMADPSETTQFVNHRVVRDGENPRLGTHADLWTVVHPRFQGELIFSQTYSEWHPLNLCYKLRDWWEVDHYTQDSESGGPRYAVSTFDKPGGGRGYLIYSGFDASGEIIPPPESGIFQATVQRCQILLGRGGFAEGDKHAMLQLWITSDRALPEEVFAQAIESFGEARQRFAAAIQAEREVE
jgi:hypothetical protein